MYARVLLALVGSIAFFNTALNAAPKHHVSRSQVVKPDLVVVNGTDVSDPKRRIDIINKSVVNHSSFKYSSVVLVMAFYDENDKLLKEEKLMSGDLSPGATLKVVVPVSFLGTPLIGRYSIVSLGGVRNGKYIVSYTPNPKVFNFHDGLIDVTIDPAARDTGLHYVGPTVDSLFTNPGLRLLQADFTPASTDGIAKLTGIVQNVSNKAYSYVEVDANAYDYEGGTQIDNGLANTTSLAPGEKWQFTISFLNGKESWWRITKIVGRVASP